MKSNNINATINHVLNSICPPIIIIFLVFLKLGFLDWVPYTVAALMFFTGKYNFEVGYAVGYCKKNNLL
jgi:hypothetical protein|tara:strand:- start:530 stop:736 length:207 start_codon:yes stop_codon:yes gene_type:complete